MANPAKLSKLPTGKPKNRVSQLLHSWKKSKGMKGASVHDSERQEMEAYIIQGMVAENYVQDMIQAGCSMPELLYGGLGPEDLGLSTLHEAFS